MKIGDLIVHKYKLKSWKQKPSIIIETHIDETNHWKVKILNPERGVVDIDVFDWILYEEAE